MVGGPSVQAQALSACHFPGTDYAISKPDLLSRIERGETPCIGEQAGSVDGEVPVDPNTGELLKLLRSGGTRGRRSSLNITEQGEGVEKQHAKREQL